MLDTRVSSGHCTCYMTGSGGQEWLLRCRGQLATASNASNMKILMPKPQCDQSLLHHLWSCYTLTLPVLRQWCSWISPQTWWTSWSFVATLWYMLWCMWPLIKLQKLLLSSCGKDISQSSEHRPSCWVTEEPTLKAKSSDSFVSSWAYRRLGLHPTMLKPMDRCCKLTKCWCVW